MAENLTLRQQLLVYKRNQIKGMNLSPVDRGIFGFLIAFVKPSRLGRVAIIIKPATLLRFHRALVKRKYQLLFGVKRRKKPGPKGPSADVVKVVVDIKSKNPSYGYMRIADIMWVTFGIRIDKGAVRRILKKTGTQIHIRVRFLHG